MCGTSLPLVFSLVHTDPRLAPESMNFWYSRLLVSGMQAWTQYAAVVSRCLAPGGWVEMHDFSTFELFYIGHDEAAPAAEN